VHQQSSSNVPLNTNTFPLTAFVVIGGFPASTSKPGERFNQSSGEKQPNGYVKDFVVHDFCCLLQLEVEQLGLYSVFRTGVKRNAKSSKIGRHGKMPLEKGYSVFYGSKYKFVREGSHCA
jgi:hypothetical protein